MNEEKMVNVEVEISDEEFLFLAREAHRRDITFNELVNEILIEEISKEEKTEIQKLKEI
jgi:hypothetical protein